MAREARPAVHATVITQAEPCAESMSEPGDERLALARGRAYRKTLRHAAGGSSRSPLRGEWG